MLKFHSTCFLLHLWITPNICAITWKNVIVMNVHIFARYPILYLKNNERSWLWSWHPKPLGEVFEHLRVITPYGRSHSNANKCLVLTPSTRFCYKFISLHGTHKKLSVHNTKTEVRYFGLHKVEKGQKVWQLQHMSSWNKDNFQLHSEKKDYFLILRKITYQELWKCSWDHPISSTVKHFEYFCTIYMALSDIRIC